MMIRRKNLGSDISVTFVLSDGFDGPVSVVGDFNDWTPGVNPLRRRSNGTLSATVALPAGTSMRFRYLASGGRWFDDPDADNQDDQGSLLEL